MYTQPVITVEKWRDAVIGAYRIDAGKLYAQIEEFILREKERWPWWLLLLLLALMEEEKRGEPERGHDREKRGHAAV